MPNHDDLSGEPFLKTSSASLTRSVVSAAPDEPHAAGKNILYCATIQLAWNELAARLGGAVRFEEPCPTADRLNAATASFTKEDLDEESYVAHAGEGEAALRHIRGELQRKFKGAASPGMLPDHLPPDELFVYAYLFKNLAFATPLLREEGPWGLSFQGQPVRHFGLWETMGEGAWKEQAKQVVVHDYRADNDFVIEIVSKAKDDCLIIARIPPGESLSATTREALSRTGPSTWSRVIGGASLRKKDTLKIPIIDFDLERSYDELEGRRLSQEQRSVARAEQSIRFRLDDKGALLKSEFSMGLPKGGLPRPGFAPRHFLCDGPFLVLLLRKGRKSPYLALWIEDPELLLPARPEDSPPAGFP